MGVLRSFHHNNNDRRNLYFLSTVLCWSFFFLLGTATLTNASHGSDLSTLSKETAIIRSYKWEWVLIQIDGVDSAAASTTTDSSVVVNAANSQVIITAANAKVPKVKIDKPLHKFESLVEYDTDNPKWFETGMVAFEQGSVSHLEVVLKEKDMSLRDSMEGALGDDNIVVDDTNLMESRVVLPVVFDQWVKVSPGNDHYTVHLSIRRSRTPIFTQEQQDQMNLTEVVFDLDDGSKASLVHDLTPGNTKAVLYFPGRSDSFSHPDVLKMYKDKGYDFYSLDRRACGRSRRFMNSTAVFESHNIDNFDKYKEEIDLTMDFIRKHQYHKGNYTQLLSHSHSTGALVTLNYAMMLKQKGGGDDDDPFDGYIMNGPFIDWRRGYVGGDLKEFYLENAVVLEWLGVPAMSKADMLSSYQTKNWILNRWNTTLRPIFDLDVTLEFAKAASAVQKKIIDTPLNHPITTKPVLLVASLGDMVVKSSKSEDRMPHIATNYSKHIFDYNSHDVTLSKTSKLNDHAISIITRWLDDPRPTHFSTEFDEGVGGTWTFVISVACAFVIGICAFVVVCGVRLTIERNAL